MTTTVKSPRRIAVLGHLGIHPETPIPPCGRRLLAFLAVHAKPIARVQAAGRLWPDLPEAQARTNLRRALWQVPKEWITASDGEIALDASVDLAAAQAAATRCLLGSGLSLREIRSLSQELLPGWDEEWVLGPQEDYRILRVQALEAACRVMTGTGQLTFAVLAGVAAVSADPLCESAVAALIDAHLQQGNRYAAMHCFRELAQTLQRELGVAPDPELAARIAEHIPHGPVDAHGPADAGPGSPHRNW